MNSATQISESRWTMRPRSAWGLWTLFLATLMTVGASADAASVLKKDDQRTIHQPHAINGNSDHKGLVHLELIPHHVQRRRLRRERQLRRLKQSDGKGTGFHDGMEDDDDDLEAALQAHKDRPGRYPRRERHLQAANQVAELFQGYGTHYVDLWVGTPPQRQTVIVDTGSGVTAFPCEGCSNCGVPKYHSDGLFLQSKSTSFKKLGCDECLRGHCSSGECRISMSYQEGSSWTAFESLDNCYAGGLHDSAVSLDPSLNQDDLNPFLASRYSFGLKFGCQTKLTGLFITQLADGIMGLDNARASYVQQMEGAGKIPNRSFSLCYNRQDEIDPEGTESGAFTMGGTDERMHKTPMVWTESKGRGGFYGVTIRNMYLRAGNSGDSALSSDPNAKVVPLGLSESAYSSGQVIVDSGTTDTYFSRKIGTKFASVFQQLSGTTYSHAKKTMTLDEVKALPTILIQIVGDKERNQAVRDEKGSPVAGLAEEVDPNNPTDLLLAIPPTHYMEFDPDDGVWVNRFYTDEPSGGVIGGNAMMGHDVFFEVDEGRLGWSEADCEYSSLLEKYKFSPNSSPTRENIPAPAPTPKPVPSPVPAPVQDDDAYAVDDDVATPEPSAFCSGFQCQAGMVAAVLLVVVAVAYRAIRSRSGPAYELTSESGGGGGGSTELEMPDSGVVYRDDPVETFDDEGQRETI